MRVIRSWFALFVCCLSINTAVLGKDMMADLPFEMPVIKEPVFPNRTFDIRDYGAKQGGTFKNTQAIANAIEACHEAGGGKVLIPKGIWLTGKIHLKSDVNLHVAESAEVRFSDDPDDYLPVVLIRWAGVECYNYSPLIYANGCTNIAITGKGSFDGQGKFWWDEWSQNSQAAQERLMKFAPEGIPVEKRVFGTKEDKLRSPMINLINCKNVLLEDYTSMNSPFWNNHLVYCDSVIIRNIILLNPEHAPNGDGLDIDSSRNVHIQSLYADVGDDAVALKSGLNEDGWRVNRPTENILIENCHIKKAHGGFVIGSDMSGGVRNVMVRNCYYDGTDVGIRMKSRRGRGGFVENIWVRDITMKIIMTEAIRINMHYGAWGTLDTSKKPSVFRNIFIDNITCESAAQAIKIVSLPEQPLENIMLSNINITADVGPSISNVKNIKMEKITIKSKQGQLMFLIE